MVAVICFPENSGGLPLAKIYRADTASGSYTLIDSVNARQMEFQDEDGDYSKYYKVSFANDSTETEEVPVKSVSQNVLEVIRNELKILDTEILSSEIDFYINQAKIDVQMEICKFYYGIQLTKITNTIYKLPNKFFYDLNCGGVVSILDFVFFKQALPLTVYSPKIPVVAVYADPVEHYVELSDPLASNEILKMNYFTLDRTLSPAALFRLLAYRICSMHYSNIDISNSMTNASRVQIGDIVVQNSSSSNSGIDKNAAAKIDAKYKRFVTNFKSEFIRVN